MPATENGSFIDITSLIGTFGYCARSLAFDPRTPQMDAASFRFVCFHQNWAHHSMGICHLLSFTSIAISPATTLLQSTGGTSTERTQQTKPWSNRIDLAGIFGRLFASDCIFDNSLNTSRKVECWSSSKNRAVESNHLIDINELEYGFFFRWRACVKQKHVPAISMLLALDSLCVRISH